MLSAGWASARVALGASVPDQRSQPPTPPASELGSEPGDTIDQAVLDGYRMLQDDGQPDVVTELIDVYLEDLPGRLASVRDAVAGGEPAAIRSAAHALKGSSASIGAVRLAAVSGELEALGRQGITTGASALLEAITAEAGRAALALGQLRR